MCLALNKFPGAAEVWNFTKVKKPLGFTASFFSCHHMEKDKTK